MTEVFAVLVLLLLLNIVVGLARVLRGPSAADRMLASEMFSTSAVAILLLLAFILDSPPLLDVALVLALLAALAVVTFVGRAWSDLQSRQSESARGMESRESD